MHHLEDRVGRPELGFVGVMASLPMLIKLLCYWHYPGSDDAFIHLTVVRNVVEGGGWGINPGEPVNLSSSPLFTGLIALLHWVGLDSLAAGKLLSAASGFFAIIVLYALARRLGLGAAARMICVTCAAGNFYLWRWNGVAMETTLALLLLSLACYALPRPSGPPGAAARLSGSYVAAGFFAGLGVLTRFELAVVFPCLVAHALVTDRSRWWTAGLKLGLAFAVLPIAWGVFSQFYFGSLLPTTFYAKTSPGLILWNKSVAVDLAKVTVSAFVVPLLGLAILAAVAVRRKRAEIHAGAFRRAVDLCLFPIFLTAFYYLKAPGLQSSARYFLPALHLLALVIAVAAHELGRSLDRPLLRRSIAGALGAHLAVALVFNQLYVVPVLARFRDNYWATMQSAAEVLKSSEKARSGGVLVEVDIGMLSFYAGPMCYFFDGGALASPELRNLNVREQLARTGAPVVIETLGLAAGALTQHMPELETVWTRSFASHSLTHPRTTFFCNIYENRQTASRSSGPLR